MKIELNVFGTPSLTLTHETDAEKHYLQQIAESLTDQGVDHIPHYPFYAPHHGEFSGFSLPLKYKPEDLH